MADTHPPGGWPWGKNKQSTKGDDASEAATTTTHQDKGVQEPGMMQEVPHQSIAEGEEGSVNPKDEAQSQAQSRGGEAKSAAGSAKRGSESVANKSVKYEDDQPETAESKKDDLPEDEGKDMTEPTEGGKQSQEETQKAKSQSGSKFSNFMSGAGKIVPSFGGGSKQDDSQVPDSIRRLQEEVGDDTNLTMPEGTDAGTHLPDDVERPEDLQTATDSEDGLEDGQDAQGEDDEATTEQQREGQSLAEGSKREGSQSQVRFSEEPNEEIGDTEADGTEAGTKTGTALPEGVEKPEDLETATGYTYEDTQTQAGRTQGEGTQAGTALPEGVDKAEDLQTATGYTYETATNLPEVDYSILKDCTVNKLGNVVNDKGQAIGRIVEGITDHLIGRKVDEDGKIWNDSGKQIGRAEPIPDSELQEMMDPKPFESFEGNTIDGKGNVLWNGQQVGKVVEGDIQILQGKTVDPDGDILDKSGNVIGKAERWEEEEAPAPEPEVEVDRSILAGKRVNKAGNVVDGNGVIYGRVIDGDLKRMIGRMCNKNGEIVSESGDILGHAELVSEGEREGSKEGPFADLEGLTVSKDGNVVTPAGDIVGRLVTGDPKVLAGRAVDEDGDVVDKNGNVLGKAERWTPEEAEKEKGPMAGLTVNQEGNVIDNKGNLVGKLTSGDPLICAGKEIDDDGDVVNSKGMTVGHVNLIADIPQEPEPEGETEEEREERLQREQDKKLATQMAVCLEQCLDKIHPICKMITTKIEAMERKSEDERDEEALVKEVRPLIEEGSNILREAHGVIRGLDPDGHIQANAKHKSGTREATPEEFHLAEVIKELTGTVTECIEGAKRKLEDMPHAKKELSPLWGLLGEPLFQIIAAVGLLLSGVLGIVGRLLSGLGLGGIVDGLLGTLGLNRLLDGLGLGSVVGSLTGKKKK